MKCFNIRRVAVALLTLLPLLACAQDYYKILDIDKSASDKDIKRAYRKLSKKYHPDKNPDDPSAGERFREVAEAYQALSDAESRRIYDRHGAEGLKQHQNGGSAGGGGHDPFDLFSRFFGGSGHFGHSGHQGQRLGPSMEVKVALPLRDFYTGTEKEFNLEKQVICDECHGSGSADGHTETCGDCGGRGVRITKHMLAPGIFQQMQTMCDRCGGQGQIIAHPCKLCSGQKVLKKVVQHTLVVEKGLPKDGRVTFEGEGEESPDWSTGDLIVQVGELPPTGEVDKDNEEEVEHGPTDGMFFRRKGDTLFYKEVLSLREALFGGWERRLTHLDGHEVVLKKDKGVTVQPGFVEMVKGEGMPVWKDGEDTDEFGDLVVEYVVVLPDMMDQGMRKELEGVFDKWKKKGGVDTEKELKPLEGGKKKVHDEL